MKTCRSDHNRWILLPVLGFLLILGAVCILSCDSSRPTAPPPPKFGDGDVFVSATRGDDSNPGTMEAPFKTIQKGIDGVTAGGVPGANRKNNTIPTTMTTATMTQRPSSGRAVGSLPSMGAPC